MPEIDNTPSEGIDLQDPEPKGRRAISSRLYYTGMVVLAAVTLTIIGGLCMRLLNKDTTDKQKRESHMASEAASSNRESVEKRQPPDSGTPAKPLPGKQPAPPQPNPEQPPASATHPELVHTPDYSTAPAAQPQAVSPQEQARIDAERQAYQEEIAARKAPTSYQAFMLAANGQASPPVPANQQPTLPALPPVPNPTEPPPANPTANDLLALGQRLGLVGSHPSNANAASSNPAQNANEDKTRFLSGSDEPNPADDYLKAARTDPVSEFEIQQGSVIPAVLTQGINSDTPGQVTAQTRVDVNDALCGVKRKDGSVHCYVLIPHGSKFIGEYNPRVSYGQNRIQAAWTRILFPDSTSLDLGRMNGLEPDGSAGLTGKTDNHWKDKIAGVALTSVLSAGLQISQNRSNNSVLQYPSTGEVIGASVGQNASQLGQELTRRNFDRQPTLTKKPGQNILIQVNKDIVFPGPYEPRY